jgi:hypothetical protein
MSIHIRPEAKLVCPHCRVAFKNEWVVSRLGSDRDGDWRLFVTECADCERIIVMLRQYEENALAQLTENAINLPGELVRERIVWPKSVSRAPIPATVPKGISEDYLEACTVLPKSPKASAALSRRCLQNLLVAKARVTTKDLSTRFRR